MGFLRSHLPGFRITDALNDGKLFEESVDDYLAFCKEKGVTRLEGKEYIVKDGDTIPDARNYRFENSLINTVAEGDSCFVNNVFDNSEEELDEEEVMMDAMDAGADDFEAEENCFTIYTTPDDFNEVVAKLEKYTFVSAQIEMVPQNYQKLETEEQAIQMQKLIDAMEDDDDVQNVWHNWEE